MLSMFCAIGLHCILLCWFLLLLLLICLVLWFWGFVGFFVIILFWFLIGSLYLGCSGTPYVDHSSLELRDLTAPVFWVLKVLKACATTHGLFHFLETWSHYTALASLELTNYFRLPSNSRRSAYLCRCVLGLRICATTKGPLWSVCMGVCLPGSLGTIRTLGIGGEQKRILNPPKLESQLVVSHHMSAEKSSQCS